MRGDYFFKRIDIYGVFLYLIQETERKTKENYQMQYIFGGNDKGIFSN